jgi:hypothetical protein
MTTVDVRIWRSSGALGASPQKREVVHSGDIVSGVFEGHYFTLRQVQDHIMQGGAPNYIELAAAF